MLKVGSRFFFFFKKENEDSRSWKREKKNLGRKGNKREKMKTSVYFMILDAVIYGCLVPRRVPPPTPIN